MRPIDMSEWDTHMKCMLVGRNAWDDYDRGYTDALDQMDDWLDAQPSLTIDNLRPKGRWIDMRESHKDVPSCSCSECGRLVIGLESKNHYCPSCGADMRGGGEG